MHTLTQVWVFFIALTFSFLFLGFQLGGRIGLFVAFLTSSFFAYAALHRGIRLFKNKLNAQEYLGNDSTGFLQSIAANKSNFGFAKVSTYLTDLQTPPIIWRSRPFEAHIMLNSKLLQNLNEKEVRLLALLLLSHLEKRSFVITPILSVINQSLTNFNLFSIILSSVVTFIFRTKRDLLNADARFRNISEASHFEVGFFLNKLHNFEFNQNNKSLGTEYFSVLSLKKNNLLNQYGLPSLKLRLEKIMGFTV